MRLHQGASYRASYDCGAWRRVVIVVIPPSDMGRPTHPGEQLALEPREANDAVTGVGQRRFLLGIIQGPQGTQDVVNWHNDSALQLPQRLRAFEGVSIGGPRGQYRSLLFRG